MGEPRTPRRVAAGALIAVALGALSVIGFTSGSGLSSGAYYGYCDPGYGYQYCPPPPPPRVSDHFLLYPLAQPERAGETVTLIDQFGTLRLGLEEAEWLLNPTEKRRAGRPPEPIQRPQEHLVCYGLAFISTADRTVRVSNQFADSTLKVGRPTTLCAPASKSVSGDPGPPPGDLDHYLCYDVRGETPLFRSETLDVLDQFGTRTVRIDRTRELCNPVEKRRDGLAPEPIIRPQEHLVCYRITTQSPLFSARSVSTRDQFGLETLSVVDLRRLCVPSTKI